MSLEFGEHLRNLRKQKTKYTQQDMANLLKISRSTYTYYETGKSEPSQENLKKMCDILSVDYNTLLSDGSARGIIAIEQDKGKKIEEVLHLTPDEKQIVCSYRSMSEDDKDFVMRQIINILNKINYKK